MDGSAWRIQAMMTKLKSYMSPASNGKISTSYFTGYRFMSTIFKYMAFQFWFLLSLSQPRHLMIAVQSSRKTRLQPMKVSGLLTLAQRHHLHS